jgi:PhnB protein
MNGLNTYLIFNGNCRKAMEFYQKCLGGVLHLGTYGEMPGSGDDFPKKYKNWILHARLTIKSMVLMASDTRPDISITQGNNFFVSVNCDSAKEAEKLFDAMSAKAIIDMPLQETFWAARFGMLTDQFGVKWMFNYEKPKK